MQTKYTQHTNKRSMQQCELQFYFYLLDLVEKKNDTYFKCNVSASSIYSSKAGGGEGWGKRGWRCGVDRLGGARSNSG